MHKIYNCIFFFFSELGKCLQFVDKNYDDNIPVSNEAHILYIGRWYVEVFFTFDRFSARLKNG